MSGPIEFGFRKLERLVQFLKTWSELSTKALARSAYEEANQIMRKSKDNYVPVDWANLKNSGVVEFPKIEGNVVTLRLGFGDAAAPYALAVHEHPSVASPPSWQGKAIGEILSVRGRVPWSLDGRGPKYLERPFKEALKGMDERLGAKVEYELRTAHVVGTVTGAAEE